MDEEALVKCTEAWSFSRVLLLPPPTGPDPAAIASPGTCSAPDTTRKFPVTFRPKLPMKSVQIARNWKNKRHESLQEAASAHIETSCTLGLKSSLHHNEPKFTT